jgi:glycosyltransferase involved in cell wall biosynthesis
MLDKLSIIENFSKASVFLFPSKIDSFGMTILEASYCGVPTIAFDINSAKELIENNKSGFLVKDSQEFNEKTLELSTHYDLCKQFSRESKKKALVFSPQEFYKRLSKIF